MNLSDMAREIERRRPGTLPQSVRIQKAHRSRPLLTIDRWTTEGETDGSMALVNDLAQAILRDAMVMATNARRHSDGWQIEVHVASQIVSRTVEEMDSDHGDCPTCSLFAAFCAAFPRSKP